MVTIGCIYVVLMIGSSSTSPRGHKELGNTRLTFEILKQAETRYYLRNFLFTENGKELAKELNNGEAPSEFLDGWSNEIKITASSDKVTFRSSGPDKKFESPDDLFDTISTAEIVK